LSCLLSRGSDIRIQRAGAKILYYSAVLTFHPPSQFIGAEFLGGDELLIVRRTPVKDAPILIDSRVDGGMGGPAVFRLDVENLFADADVRIEPGAHLGANSIASAVLSRAKNNFGNRQFI
jgi:hypothetical protein